MNDRLSVSAYWGPRKESAEECAERAALYLNEIGKIHQMFSTWRLKSQSRKEAVAQPLVVSREGLTALFAKGVNRRDLDKSPVSDLGFSFGAWAGDTDGCAAGLRITCGSFNERVDNICLLDVTEGHDVQADDVARIIDAAIRAWDPDAVEVNSEHVYSR